MTRPPSPGSLPRRRLFGRFVLILICAGLGCVLAWTWLAGDAMRQERVMRTILIGAAGAVLLTAWVLLLSGWRWFWRAGLVLGGLALAAGATQVLRVDGVSGDLVPIVTWRWSAAGEERDRAHTPEPAVPAVPAAVVALPGAADCPQFLGPLRSGVYPHVALARDWNVQPPRLLWRRSVGAGWSSFAVAGHRAITQEQHGEEETIVCYDLASGAILWKHADAARYDNPIAGVGPRATPTIAGDLVYAHGSTGLLNCLELESGRRVWSIDVLDDNGAGALDWGMSGSPLVVDDLLVINAGGAAGRSLVAYDGRSGRRVWSSGSDQASYSSPALAEIGGTRQVVIVNQHSLSGHDPASGDVLWEYDWPGDNPKVAQPLFLGGDRVMVSAGYGLGADMLALERDARGVQAPRQLWHSLRLKAKFASAVARGDFVYGLDDGILTCIALESGERQWKSGRYGHGQVLLAGDVLLIQAESGEVVLVEAVPDDHRQLASLEALSDKTWNVPALAGRYLLVRNDREAACFELP